MDKLSLCIVILHYNNFEMTKSYVENLKKLSSKKFEKHIIIVDNKSPDESGKLLLERFENDLEVKVLLLDENLGFAKGNNVGILFAREKYEADLIAVSNSDIEIPDIGFFDKVVDIYERDRFDIFGPDIFGVHYQFHQSPIRPNHMTLEQIDSRIKGLSETIRKVKIIKKSRLYNLLYYARKIMSRFSLGKKGFQRNYSEYQIGAVLQGAFFVLAKSYLKAYPDGLYPGTFLYLEEDILNYRAKLKNLKVIYDPSVSVRHLEGMSSLSHTGDRCNKYIFELEQTRKSCFVMRKYMLQNLKRIRHKDFRNKKISVIIPCYNVEKYIEKCMDSVLGQTHKNIEIILVDDGSTDRTGSICEAYADSDIRVKVIHRENGGAAAARNTGIETAVGDYVIFIDSDDWIEKDTLEYLLSMISKYRVECAIGRTRSIFETGGIRKISDKIIEPDRLISSSEIIKQVLTNGSGTINKLFNREIFKKIRFSEGITNEDEVIMLNIYTGLEYVAFGGRQTYYYRKRDNSVTTSAFSVKNLDFYYNTKANIDLIRNTKPELLDYAIARHLNAAIYCSAKLHFNILNSEGSRHRKIIRKDLRENRRELLSNRHITIKFKVIGLICSFI